MFEKILVDIGFTKGEARVYSSLNKIGSSTIGPIVDNSGISRSKIYDVLERLIQKGLVSYITKDKTKYFQANDPTKIKDFLEKKENEIKADLKEVDDLIPLMLAKRETGKENPSVQIYEGFQGLITAHDHVFTRLKKGDEYYFYGISSFQEEKYHEIWKEAHKRRVRLEIKCKLLFNRETPKSVMRNRNSYTGSEARYMPKEMETPSWIMVYDNVTIIGLQSKKGMAIEIVNKEISESFKEYFRILWGLSERYE